jgi:HK97 family phage prohead protease
MTVLDPVYASDLVAEFRVGLTGVRETRNFPYQGIELRDAPDGSGGNVVTFEGYACATERDYPMWDAAGEYRETIHQGSFKRTLAEGPDVAFLVNHEGLSLARTKAGNLDLLEDGSGLLTRARLNPRSMAVQELRIAVEDGNLDQMSFAFRVDQQEWSEDWMERHINGVNLHRGDTSAVNFGANEASQVSYLRHAGIDPTNSERLYGLALTGIEAELRAGATLSGSTLAVLKHVLDLVAAADVAVDNAQPLLADLIGVPNPDTDAQKNAADEPLLDREAFEKFAARYRI